jgi:hypothetical protein
MNTLPVCNQESTLSSIQNETLYTYPQEKDTDEDRYTIDELEKRRTIVGETEPESQHMPKYILGNTLYVVVFVIIIPAIMIHQHFNSEFILAYMPNVDMLATILGYDGGPMNMWRYLYNPNNFTIFGFANTTFINYLALLGLTYVIASTTHEKRSWEYGWAGAFIAVFLTYLLPGNPIVILQNKIEEKLANPLGITDEHRERRYIFMVSIGIAMAAMLILLEASIIKVSRPYLVRMIKYLTIKLK